MDRIDMENYHQMGGTYVVPTEIMNVLLDENETLNKGIDELLKKYEYELENIHRQWGDDVFHYHTYEKDLYKEAIQDLNKLKGE